MNPFEQHGIDHLSASSLNLFAAAPAVWVLEKVLKRRQPVGAAAHRGTAVEDGVAHGLMNGAAVGECVAVAQAKFASLTALSGDPRKDKEQDSIKDMVVTALGELRPYGPPSHLQGRIEYAVDGLAVPLIGFYDFKWAESGVLVDLKTTHRLPSEISTSHARQIALYRAALGDNLDARITYATTKKVATYRLENAREHVQALERIALTVQRFLAVSADPMELAGIVVPDVDSFYLADPAARSTAHQVWGV